MSAEPLYGVGRVVPATNDRILRRFAAAAGMSTLVLLLAAAVTGPPSQRSGLMAVIGLGGGMFVAAAWVLGRGLPMRFLTLAGLVLMALGIVAGALLPDGLDGAAVLPLAGAVLALPAHRGRRLMAIFALACAAAMVGETAAYVSGGMMHLTGLVDVRASLLESGVMLAFTYGLVWWVGNRWWDAHESATHALASQRRLLEVNERLLSTLDPEGVLQLIADSLKAVLPYDNLTIYRIDRAERLLRPVLARDRFASLIMETTFPLGRGITGWVVENRTAQCVNDAHRDPRTSIIPGTPAESESLIVVPLVAAGEVVGTLNVGRMGGSEAHFRGDEFELARLYAGQASIALQNAEAHREVETRAETDGLTGLLNRRAFDERLGTLAADPRARPLALVMLDLDGFKEYNDRQGHPAGDALLRAAAQGMCGAVRQGDLCFRFGGDEFAILLPRTEQEAAFHVADRVRQAITASAPDRAATVTASLGFALTRPNDVTGTGLVAQADEALYRAKQAGGDDVVAAAPPASWAGPA